MKFRPWKWAYWGWQAVPVIGIIVVVFGTLATISVVVRKPWWEIPSIGLLGLMGVGLFFVVCLLVSAFYEWVDGLLMMKKQGEYIQKEIL